MKSKTLSTISEIFSIIAVAISSLGLISFSVAAVLIMVMERGSIVSNDLAITGVVLIGVALVCSVIYAVARKAADKKFYLERGI